MKCTDAVPRVTVDSSYEIETEVFEASESRREDTNWNTKTVWFFASQFELPLLYSSYLSVHLPPKPWQHIGVLLWDFLQQNNNSYYLFLHVLLLYCWEEEEQVNTTSTTNLLCKIKGVDWKVSWSQRRKILMTLHPCKISLTETCRSGARREGYLRTVPQMPSEAGW